MVRPEVDLFSETFLSRLGKVMWHEDTRPTFSSSERVLLVLEDIFAIYKDQKLDKATVIVTDKQLVMFGNEVKKSLIASQLARDIEHMRRWDQDPKKLSKIVIRGAGFNHDRLRRVEIIRRADIFSLFFFDDVERLYIINDLTNDDVAVIKELLSQFSAIEVNEGDFQIPLIDILLFFIGGFITFFLGLLLIAIIL